MRSHVCVYLFAIVTGGATPAMAGNICAGNTEGRTSACGSNEGGCYAWRYGFYPNQWAALGASDSVCCYDPRTSTCSNGAIKDNGANAYVLCPMNHPITGNKMWRCGLWCLDAPIQDNSLCTYESATCNMFQYQHLCGLDVHCANSCTQTCAQQGKGDCNGHCYDTKTQHCVNGVVCSNAQDQTCNGKCFDSKSQHCVSNTVCALSQDQTCNGRCFNSKTQHCLNNVVCAMADDSVCSGACFQSQEQVCINSRYLCDRPNDSVCGATCYQKSEKSCPDGSHLCTLPKNAYDSCAGCYQTRQKTLESTCYQDNQCQKGKCSGFSSPFCSQGKCVCTSDADCASGQYCWTGVAGIGTNDCRNKNANGSACTKDHQCTSGRCYWGSCKACDKNSQCPNGQTCQNSRCQ